MVKEKAKGAKDIVVSNGATLNFYRKMITGQYISLFLLPLERTLYPMYSVEPMKLKSGCGSKIKICNALHEHSSKAEYLMIAALFLK